jgi:hypothetical protein
MDKKDCINRVRATYAALNDSEFSLGSYRTQDIGVVLELLNDQEVKLACVKEDLEDLVSLEQKISSQEAALMVRSILELMEA